jgi:hypothetical protein
VRRLPRFSLSPVLRGEGRGEGPVGKNRQVAKAQRPLDVTPVLLDTNGYAAFKRTAAEAVTIIQRAPDIFLNTVVLGELLAGFSLGARQSAKHASFRHRPLPGDDNRYMFSIDGGRRQGYSRDWL